MIDLAKTTAENAKRRKIKAKISDGPWTIYQSIWCKEDREFVASVRNDNAEDVIDALIAEIERLLTERATLTVNLAAAEQALQEELTVCPVCQGTPLCNRHGHWLRDKP